MQLIALIRHDVVGPTLPRPNSARLFFAPARVIHRSGAYGASLVPGFDLPSLGIAAARHESAHDLLGGDREEIAARRHRPFEAHRLRTKTENRVDTQLV